MSRHQLGKGALLSWRQPTTLQWLLLLAVGGFATAGQLLLTRGYAAAPAGRVGPFTYTAVIFGALFGYLFWGETLDALFFVGAALIMVAGVLAVVRNPRPITASVDLAR